MNRRIESSTDSDKHFNVVIEKKIINLDCPSELNYDTPPPCYKKLEKTVIVLILTSLTYPALADIHERPWQDKVYTDFLTWDY